MDANPSGAAALGELTPAPSPRSITAGPAARPPPRGVAAERRTYEQPMFEEELSRRWGPGFGRDPPPADERSFPLLPPPPSPRSMAAGRAATGLAPFAGTPP